MTDRKHNRDINHFEGRLEQLAVDVGQLTFDRLADFLYALTKELAKQSEADRIRNRPKLAGELAVASELLYEAIPHINEAWKIAKPHMTPAERGEA